MTFLQAIFLGIIQGATEFLPVSSSGHLRLGQELLGLREPQLLFDIVLHVGTLLAVVIFYRRELVTLFRGLLAGVQGLAAGHGRQALLEPEGMRLAWLVLLATLPTGVLGLVLEKLLDPPEGAEPLIGPVAVCALLLVNGFILFANRFVAGREQAPRSGRLVLWNVTPAVALAIGVAQGIAVLPGLSRSGLTITAALLLGVDRQYAARYSFMLMIPAILGALVLKFDLDAFGAGGHEVPLFLLGAAVAAVVGYGCLVLLTRLLERAQFHHFSWYCWAVGIVGLLFFLS